MTDAKRKFLGTGAATSGRAGVPAFDVCCAIVNRDGAKLNPLRPLEVRFAT